MNTVTLTRPLTTSFFPRNRSLGAFFAQKRFFSRVFVGHQHCIPHPEKAAKGGEDAMFLSRKACAVADGVGGWMRCGVDPAEYSRSLIANLQKNCNKGKSTIDKGDFYIDDPITRMQRAYNAAERVTGSSTLCMATLKDPDTIDICNVGDSGAMIFRPEGKRLMLRTEEGVHGFNFPKQLGTGSDDVPEHATVDTVGIRKDDLVFLATDGVFDNVFDEDILDIIGDDSLSIQARATKIAMLAFQNSLNPDYRSPFAMKEFEYYMARLPKGTPEPRLPIVGGKSDDISIVLAQITDEKND